MLSRTDALEALGGERFDVVVIGGGITGAGVALDAASRGYSVALVERDDYASGTSSRSSKMVHGGLRYLQNFDLGLVREALLERQLMVELAPHLVYPTPFLVPTLGEERRNWRIGIGLNMYDVMATTRVGQGRRERQARERASQERGLVRADAGSDYWAPDRHRTIPGEEAAELIPALAPRDPKEAYLFYDCQTDDVRLVLTVLGEAERFGAVFCNGAEVVELISDGGQGRGRRLHGRRQRRALRGPGRQRGQRDRGLGRPHPARRRSSPRRRSRGSPRAAAPTSRSPSTSFPLAPGRLHRAGGRGADDLRAALVRAGADRHHGPRLRRRHRTRPAVRRGHRVPARGGQLVLRRSSWRRRDLTGAYAGVRPLISTGDPRKSVDISRRAELYETSSGLLTITGGKLTTWRRMAKQVVDRMVEREGREAPCRTAEIPLGMPATEEDLQPPVGLSPRRPARRLPSSCSPSATGTRRATC